MASRVPNLPALAATRAARGGCVAARWGAIGPSLAVCGLAILLSPAAAQTAQTPVRLAAEPTPLSPPATAASPTSATPPAAAPAANAPTKATPANPLVPSPSATAAPTTPAKPPAAAAPAASAKPLSPPAAALTPPAHKITAAAKTPPAAHANNGRQLIPPVAGATLSAPPAARPALPLEIDLLPVGGAPAAPASGQPTG